MSLPAGIDYVASTNEFALLAAYDGSFIQSSQIAQDITGYPIIKYVTDDIWLVGFVDNSDVDTKVKAIRIDSTGAVTASGTTATVRADTSGNNILNIFKADADNKLVVQDRKSLIPVTVDTSTLAVTVGTGVTPGTEFASGGLWQVSSTVYVALASSSSALNRVIYTLSGTTITETSSSAAVSSVTLQHSSSPVGIVVPVDSTHAVYFEFGYSTNPKNIEAWLLTLSGTTITGSSNLVVIAGNSDAAVTAVSSNNSDVLPAVGGGMAAYDGEDYYVTTSYGYAHSTYGILYGLVTVRYDTSAGSIVAVNPSSTATAHGAMFAGLITPGLGISRIAPGFSNNKYYALMAAVDLAGSGEDMVRATVGMARTNGKPIIIPQLFNLGTDTNANMESGFAINDTEDQIAFIAKSGSSNFRIYASPVVVA